VRSAHLGVPGDPLMYTVRGWDSLAIASQLALLATSSPPHNSRRFWRSVHGTSCGQLSSGFLAARDQAWLWDSNMPAPSQLDFALAEEDGLA
jgi:hypothetical protein